MRVRGMTTTAWPPHGSHALLLCVRITHRVASEAAVGHDGVAVKGLDGAATAI